MQSKKIQLTIQVLSIVLFALVSALVPQEYVFVFFLLYFLVMMLVFSRLMSSGFKKPGEIKTQPIFKEDDVSKIIASDIQLLQEIREQFRPMMILFALTFLVILIAPLYWQYIADHVKSTIHSLTGNEFLTKFITILFFYLFLMAIMFLPRTLATRRLKQKKQIHTPRRYAVHREGLILDGRLLAYSKDLCIKVNSKRRFVEIHGEKLPFIIRLYTIDASRLADKLEEVGLDECREQT